MTCPRCKQDNPPQAKYCLECATPLASLGRLPEAEVPLLALGQLEQRLDAEGVVGQPGVLVADLG